MVRQAKKLLKEKGILESSDQKPGKSLSKEVVQAVHSFYESDDISRVMPGKKDCVTIKGENGDKSVVSKRLILCNLKAVSYTHLNSDRTDCNVGTCFLIE